jgi:1-phosphofructokinase family hexose kinase
MIVTITANPCLDRNVLVQRMVVEDTMHPIKSSDDPGGSGINVSRVLTHFRRANIAVGFLGGGTGQDLTRLLDNEKVVHEFTTIAGNTRTNLIISDNTTREQYRISFPGPEITPAELDSFMESMKQRVDADYWSIGGSLSNGTPKTLYRDLIKLGNAHGVKVVLDSSGESFALGLEATPFMVKPNEFELSRIANRQLNTREDFVSAARALHRQGVSIVVASRGAQGAILVSDQGTWSAVPPPVEVRSKVGAGDSTVAGILMALADGLSHDEAVRLGVACGTATTMVDGTGLCQEPVVKDLYERVAVESID